MKNIIFYFHSVGYSPMSIRVEDFENVICYLSKYYKLVTVSELIQKHFNQKEVEGYCAISFDDYFRDAQINTTPILKSYNAKATFYVTLNYVNKKLWGNKNKNRWKAREDAEYNIPFDLMKWSDIYELISNKHEVGAHTITHPNLTECSDEDASIEIQESKKALEKKLGILIKSFAYTRGLFGEREKIFVKDCGFENAVTTLKNYVDQSQDIFSIARFPGPISEKHLEYFFAGKFKKYQIKILNGIKFRLNKVFKN